MKKIGISALFFVLCCAGFAQARIKEMSSERNFLLRIQDTPFAVVLFYDSAKANKDEQRQIRHLKRDMQYVVQAEGLYQNAHVGLFAVDAGRDRVAPAAGRLGIDQYPTIMLFKAGVPIKNKQGKIVLLRGCPTRSAIRDFIDKNMREDVMNFMEDKYEASAAAAQADRTHLYFSYGMTLPASVQYGYPYYYWPDPYYGYGAPGVGVQLGF